MSTIQQSQTPIEYVPENKTGINQSKSEYVLIKDVTGKSPPKRGPQILKAYTEIKNEKTGKWETIELEFKVPFPPKSNCKKCHGRGYTGIITNRNQKNIYICKKCFPMV